MVEIIKISELDPGVPDELAQIPYSSGEPKTYKSSPGNLVNAGLDELDISADTITQKIAHWRVINAGETLTIGDGKDYFVVPAELNGYNLVSAHAAVDVVSSSGTPTVQLRNVTDSVDMLSTRITIDESEFTSYTASAAPVIDTTKDDVATGDRIACDVDVAGTSTKGLVVIMTFQLP